VIGNVIEEMQSMESRLWWRISGHEWAFIYHRSEPFQIPRRRSVSLTVECLSLEIKPIIATWWCRADLTSGLTV